jgi:redox-sensitive bicupin YhaK (pirin superfamily)
MVPAYFGMLWGEDIPTVEPARGVSVTVIAGSLRGSVPPAPPPDSWAARPDSDLAIWLIRLAAEAEWTVPPATSGVNRMLHLFRGDQVDVSGVRVGAKTGARVRPDAGSSLRKLGGPAEFLILQGRPIGAPVFQM